MAARSIQRPRLFTHSFPLGVSMDLLRLQAWEWDGVKAEAARAAAEIRNGGAALQQYGFDADEFSVLADPKSWPGFVEFIYAVELGVGAILSVSGMNGENGETFEPGEFAGVSFLMRHPEIRKEFLAVMDREGSIYSLEPAEGNA